MIPVDEDTIRAEDFEARLKGKKPASRCPFCRSECEVVSNEHHYGETWVEEFLHIECVVCDIVLSCRQCHKYALLNPHAHPAPEKLLQSSMCKCPPEEPRKEGEF